MTFQTGKSSGFTLIEMVISSALAAMILVAAYMCLNACLASQKLIEPRAEVAQNARTALAIMTADLRTACSLSKEFDFLGMDRTLEDVEADNMDFATHNYFPRRPGEADFCEVSYFLEKDKAGKFNLWRRRNPTIALDPLTGGVREEIARELLGLRFEYFDGFDWYDDWGQLEPRKKEKDPLLEPTNLSGIPGAVRITLSFDPNPGKRRAPAKAETVASEPALVFQTVVRLELLGSSTEPANAEGGGGKPDPTANRGNQPN
ncbi:MAG: prepilin-type N-terminal cleavage/methylation domain-containing protein [Verrucomicrobiota bacterium]